MTKLVIANAMICLVACTASDAVQDQREWLTYEPAVVELVGVLRLTQQFGPPNFGETPETDSVISVPFLTLTTPINVRGDSTATVNDETHEQVAEIQLVLSPESDLSSLVDQRVAVTGALFQKHTGHHFADVLMNVQSFARDSSNE